MVMEDPNNTEKTERENGDYCERDRANDTDWSQTLEEGAGWLLNGLCSYPSTITLVF